MATVPRPLAQRTGSGQSWVSAIRNPSSSQKVWGLGNAALPPPLQGWCAPSIWTGCPVLPGVGTPHGGTIPATVLAPECIPRHSFCMRLCHPDGTWASGSVLAVP